MCASSSSDAEALLLAPFPFYQERGTPIATALMLEAYQRRGIPVRVLTFAEGADRAGPGVTIERLPPRPGLNGIRPGFSIKKLLCDIRLAARAARIVRVRRPRWIHAVEESVFIARPLARRAGIPYVYDMDSSLADQLVEKMAWLAPLRPFFRACERAAARDAALVVPVCPALAHIARDHGARAVRLLTDISLLDASPPAPADDLRAAYGIAGPLFLYLGNLERYQGVDLLLDAFARLSPQRPDAHLVVIGGPETPRRRYTARAAALGLGARVHFPGPRPPQQMAALFTQADVLVSPRIKGRNTPMKLYSYLDAGRPVVATDIESHTQALEPDCAALAAPEPAAFAAALRRLADAPDERARLAANARALVARRYSRAAYFRTAEAMLDEMDQRSRAGEKSA